MLKSTQIRSFLAQNVDIMLESISAQRQRNKIDSDDLFGSFTEESNTAVPWRSGLLPHTDLQVLLYEKESLGIYVSGNPLREYTTIQTWVRDITFTDGIYLVIINKLKKIFTKSNNMMFAFELSTSGDSVEGIIFPKLAPLYSNILEEKQLYWIRGKMSQKKKKTSPLLTDESLASLTEDRDSQSIQDQDGNSNDTEPDINQTNDIKEYDELPKLIIEAICKFEDGPLPLFNSDIASLSVNRIDTIAAINWNNLLTNPNDFNNGSEHITSDTFDSNTKPGEAVLPKIQPQKVILKKHLGPIRLREIHRSISKDKQPNSQEIELWIETGGELKKVKGPLWITSKTFSEIKQGIK